MNLSKNYCHFYDDDAFVETDRPGFRRRVITGEHLQLCFWRIDGGATGSFMHKHDDHEQLGVVVRGALDFRISPDENDTERQTIGPSEFYLANPGIWHGDSNFIGDDEFGECWILDIFSPPRDDLRAVGTTQTFERNQA